MSRFAGIVLALAALHVGPAHAQPAKKPPTISFDGTEVFSYLLKARKFTPILDMTDLANHEARETVVIVFGQNDVLAEIRKAVGGWRAFLQTGGAVLIATDSPDHGRLASLGVTVVDESVLQAAPGGYKGELGCPLLREFAAVNPALFEGLKGHGLATNRPSYLTVRRNGKLRPLATFPRDCLIPWHAPSSRLEDNPPRHYIAGTPFDAKAPGRALVFAGHGVFTNGMLLQQDNDNFDFAVNCLRWLREGPDGESRRYALFVVDGEVIQSFDVGLKPPMPPMPVPTIALANQLLTGMEREGFFLRLLEDNVDVHKAVQVALIALTVLLLVYGSKKLAEVRHHAEGRSVAMAGPYAEVPNLAPLAKQRRQSQVERDGLWEEARAVARQGLLEICGISLGQWDTGSVGCPRVESTGGWLEQYRLRRQAERVWSIAARRTPNRFSWAELVRLTRSLQELRHAVQEGRLRIHG